MPFLPRPFAWCAIPAGMVTLRDDHGILEHVYGPFRVSAFEMAQYPVTNAQFQVFADAADGYANPEWWDYSARAQSWHAGHGLEDTPFPGDDHPRTVVSWFEAVAFSRWLSARTGEPIRLPTEQEWQRAAQGEDARAYPWGSVFDISRANTSESGIKEPTPVTQYPGGTSPFGVMDLCGNVAEWCLNAYNIPDDSDITAFAGGDLRAMRGGSWGLSQFSAQTTFRGFNHPGDRFNFLGFRLVRHRDASALAG
jgi:formylglycine-generating enzyme required for sulfatase activity